LTFRRGPWRALIIIGLFAAAAILAALLEPLPPAIAGRASASDGDTLRLGSDRVRLIGLDAPELDQTCLDATGTAWSCGRVARDRLRALVADAEVRCETEGRDRYGRYLGRCEAAGEDLGGILVEEGLALADLPSYAGEEARARQRKRGVWAGQFDTPREWRETHGDTAAGFDLPGWIRSWFR
jgi:endonuclease YncB( thermonuclease family)